MEEQLKPEQTFTFVMTKADAEMIINGLGELPAKYSHFLINKMEMVMKAQSIEPEKPEKL